MKRNTKGGRKTEDRETPIKEEETGKKKETGGGKGWQRKVRKKRGKA